MILRLSQKLSKKINVAPKSCAPPDENPFADWSAHLFTAARTQYIILTNTQSLYSMVMPGKGITDDRRFVDAAIAYIRESLCAAGMEFIFQKFIEPASREVAFSKPLNRSVIGSMNDLVFQAKFLLTEREESSSEVSSQLDETPMSALRYRNPKGGVQGVGDFWHG